MSRAALVVALLLPLPLSAQSAPEPLKGPELAMYQDLRAGKERVTDANRAILEKQSKYIVGKLTDPSRIKADSLAAVIEDAINDLGVIRVNRPKVIKDEIMAFSREMGDAMIKELGPALSHPRVVVRVNAARLLSVLGMIGYDKTAGPALEILKNEKEQLAVKLYALKALRETFEFSIDAALPEQSVFRKENRALEHDAIVALCDFILKPIDVTGLEDDEVAAVNFVRAEAVRALTFCRRARLEFGGQVLARPALVLLKVANRDGISPLPSIKERSEALEGFGRLFPVVRTEAPRQLACDYAAEMLASAILDLATTRLNNPAENSIPWRASVEKWDHSTKLFAQNAQAMNLTGAAAVKDLSTRLRTDLVDPIVKAAPINAAAFREWLNATKPQAKSLFLDEPNTTIKPTGRD